MFNLVLESVAVQFADVCEGNYFSFNLSCGLKELQKVQQVEIVKLMTTF